MQDRPGAPPPGNPAPRAPSEPSAEDALLASVAVRASTLFERLEASRVGPRDERGENGSNARRVEERLAAWCRTSAGGDPARFARRLARDGLDVETVRAALSRAPDLPAHHDSPGWTRRLADAIRSAAVGYAPDAPSRRYLDPGEPIPFEDVLEPFVRSAARRIETGSDGTIEMLPERLLAALERSLLKRLFEIASSTLSVEFSVFRASRQIGAPLLSVSPSDPGEPPATDDYQAFTHRMLGGGWWGTSQRYPVLARLLVTTADFWVESTAEFLLRLRADADAIRQTFGGGADPGPWVRLEASLSDPHHHGRSVIVLASASGLVLVYKPRGLATEAAYGRLVRWLNEQGAPLPLRAPEVLERGTHGWAKFVEHRSCRSEEEAARFYRRAGMQLCLLYVLEATDCHRENLVACGEHPVIVDLETLMHPRERRVDGHQSGESTAALVHDLIEGESVVRVGLLPRWDLSDPGETFDLSGLRSHDGEQVVWQRTWRHVNTDRMESAIERAPRKPAANVPRLDGAPLSAHEFQREIVDGFRSMYRFLEDRKDALLAPDGPVAGMAGLPVRFILRDTEFYEFLHARTLHPRFLADGVDRTIELEALARRFLGTDDHPLWPIMSAEREALERLDVPHFTAFSDSLALPLGCGTGIERCFGETSHARVTFRVSTMSDEDLDRQTAFIQASFFSRTTGAGRARAPSEEPEPSLDTVAPLDERALLARAIEIAEALRERAVRCPGGGATWIVPTSSVDVGQFELEGLGYDLYTGSTGVALFLSALEGVTGGVGFRDLALAALAPLREVLRAEKETRGPLARALGIGGALGLGSVVYALVRAAGFLGDPSLLEDARAAAARISPEAIADDAVLDVLGGSAGAILGLLALQEDGDAAALERAALCGKRLLAARTSWEGGPRAWATLERRPLTGYSHGAAGISYALLRLVRATADRDLVAAAEEGIAYERGTFVRESGNWLDYRGWEERKGAPRFFTTWCHGAPGIGLARLGGLGVLDTAEVRADIEVALRTTLAYGLRPLEDHLCCGHFGRMDLLVTAADLLGRPELLETARRQAAWLVERAARSGGFYLHDMLPHGVHNPSFFTGTAGIGYQLLRLAYPHRLPSALSWS